MSRSIFAANPGASRGARRGVRGLAVAIAVVLTASSCSGGEQVERVPGGPTGSYIVPAGVHKIKHVIVIMQENRSFDYYFGTFPGADGIPMKNGKPTVCVPDPASRDVRRTVRRSRRRERRRAALGQERDG